MSIQKKKGERDHVLAKMYYMIDMESGNIGSARDLKMDYIKRLKGSIKKIHVFTHKQCLLKEV